MSTYQASYHTTTRGQRSPSAKASYSPGNWKNYIVNDFMVHKQNRTSRDSLSHRALSPSNSINQLHDVSKYRQQEQKEKKKDQIMKRVKQIQNRVKPLLEDNHMALEEEYGWESKLEKRILKLETAVDAIYKEIDIKTQKRILQVEKRFDERLKNLQARLN